MNNLCGTTNSSYSTNEELLIFDENVLGNSLLYFKLFPYVFSRTIFVIL